MSAEAYENSRGFIINKRMYRKVIITCSIILSGLSIKAQIPPGSNVSFYKNLASLSIDQLKAVIKSRADSTADKDHPNFKTRDLVIIDGVFLTINYYDALFVLQLKNTLDNTPIESITFWNEYSEIGGGGWRSAIIISTYNKDDWTIKFRNNKSIIKIRKSDDYNVSIHSKNGDVIKEIASQATIPSPHTFRKIKKETIGKDNLLVVYTEDKTFVSIAFYKDPVKKFW
jgi:hypothetical protein